jgi:hypothetical protein
VFCLLKTQNNKIFNLLKEKLIFQHIKKTEDMSSVFLLSIYLIKEKVPWVLMSLEVISLA